MRARALGAPAPGVTIAPPSAAPPAARAREACASCSRRGRRAGPPARAAAACVCRVPYAAAPRGAVRACQPRGARRARAPRAGGRAGRRARACGGHKCPLAR